MELFVDDFPYCFKAEEGKVPATVTDVTSFSIGQLYYRWEEDERLYKCIIESVKGIINLYVSLVN